MHQPFLVHPLADTGFVHQVDADLLQNTGANTAEDVITGLALKDHRINSRLVQ